MVSHLSEAAEAGLPLDIRRTGLTEATQKLITEAIRAPPINSGMQMVTLNVIVLRCEFKLLLNLVFKHFKSGVFESCLLSISVLYNAGWIGTNLYFISVYQSISVWIGN